MEYVWMVPRHVGCAERSVHDAIPLGQAVNELSAVSVCSSTTATYYPSAVSQAFPI